MKQTWPEWEADWLDGDVIEQMRACWNMTMRSKMSRVDRFEDVRDLVAACMVCAASEWDCVPSDLDETEVELVTRGCLVGAVDSLNERMAAHFEPWRVTKG